LQGPVAALDVTNPDSGANCEGPPGWRVWDYRSGLEILRLKAMQQPNYELPALAPAPRGESLALAVRDCVRIFDLLPIN
jgi:hypothetical protein